jgi:hypothetical protein
MRRISRQILIGALILIFLSSACGRLTFASPTPVWTVTPTGQPFSTATLLPSDTPVSSTLTPVIPITGENVVSLQCEFCVEAESHAVLIFPESAYFDVSSDTPVSCLTADVTGGERILICHGTQATTFSLNVCSDSANCLEFPVALQPCPVSPTDVTPIASNTPFVPFNLTPIGTRKASTKERRSPTGTPVSSNTPIPGGTAVNTPTTPIPTSYPNGSLVGEGQ